MDLSPDLEGCTLSIEKADASNRQALESCQSKASATITAVVMHNGDSIALNLERNRGLSDRPG